MLVHCNMKVRPVVIWFLHPTTQYTNRKLEIAHCPVCRKLIVRYVQENISTGNINSEQLSKGKAEKLMEELSTQKEYTSLDLIKNKGLYGFRYGENREVKKNGKKVIVQKSVDFYGNKEIVKQLPRT